MVSIPDWSKFSRLGQSNAQPSSLTKYQKQRDVEIMRQAQEHGYFTVPDKKFLLAKFCSEKADENCSKVSRIKMVKLPSIHLKSVGDIGMCTRMRICILHGNYIANIESLRGCRELFKLDLHGNQITSLPSSSFWQHFKKLKLLYLHDNPIGAISNLQSLSTCVNLQILTLYDTPLALKKNYRHHVVNSIFSLKALDHHVISDEEIIEDAVFVGRFKTCHPVYYFYPCPRTPLNYTYEDEKDVIKNLFSDITHIMAKRSPVLIVQKTIRGYLTKKRYKIIQDTRIWAAVTIQRFYRTYKAWPQKLSTDLPPPPNMDAHSVPLRSQSRGAESVKMDFDDYLQNQRPGSVIPSDSAADQISSEQKSRGLKSGDKKKKNLFINLSKLQTSTLQSLQHDNIIVETMTNNESSTVARVKSKSESDLKKCKKKEKVHKIVKDIKQFFGPVVPIRDDTPTSDHVVFGGEEEIPVTGFRLRGFKPQVFSTDKLADIIISRREAGRDVRAAEVEYHRRKDLSPKPFATNIDKRVTKDIQYFARVQGSMGLSCLRAVHQAYKDREKAEKITSKMERILNAKDDRESAKERIRLYHEEKRAFTMKERERNRMKVIEMLERNQLMHLNYIEKTHESLNKSKNFSKSRQAELTFVSDFNTQHTSVSNALLKHDRQAKHEEVQNNKIELVQSTREAEIEQQQLVKKYLEHRQQMRQTETSISKGALDGKILQEANERIMQARTRVAQLKARQEKVKTFYPLPDVKNKSIGGPDISENKPKEPARFNRWQESTLTSGRVGQHPTIVKS